MDCVVLDTLDPYFNQACEESLFLHRTGSLLVVWRNAPAVVCGKYQNIYAEVSLPSAQAQNIAILRRETGGGTVYHDEGNLNYAIMTDRGDTQGYEPFLAPIVDALRALGADAQTGRICDIAVNGKKVSGSAQKVSGGRVWHHGTLLFSADLTRLRGVANGARREYVSKGVQSSPWPVANLCDVLPHTDALAFRDALLRKLGAEPTLMTAEELATAETLAREKYRAWDWTFGKNPAFTLTRQTPQGELVMESKNGVITALNLAPEFVGQRLDPQNPVLLASPLCPYLF